MLGLTSPVRDASTPRIYYWLRAADTKRVKLEHCCCRQVYSFALTTLLQEHYTLTTVLDVNVTGRGAKHSQSCYLYVRTRRAKNLTDSLRQQIVAPTAVSATTALKDAPEKCDVS